MNGSDLTDFETASRKVLQFLHQRLGFDLWMVTRTAGNDWIVLQTEDHGYGVVPGNSFRWDESFCYEMVRGNGPCIAPRSEDVPAYAAAPIGRQVPIKAYVGVPLLCADGSLFGTLCAIHPVEQPASLSNEQALVELLGALLGSVLHAELRAVEDARRMERLQAEALTDALTGTYNRRGWGQLLAAEEERCRRYGHPAAVIVVDLDGLKLVNDTQGHPAGDTLIARTGCVLRDAVRSRDIVARLGGDEFAVLGVECDRAGGAMLLARVRAALANASIAASVGLAMRDPATGLAGAWEAADRAMYAEKRAQRLSHAR